MDKRRKFRFKLAGHLGKTVAQLEEEMTYNEFNEWYEYSLEEQLIADRLEMKLAQVVSSMAGISPVEAMVSLSKEDKDAQAQKDLHAKIKASIG